MVGRLSIGKATRGRKAEVVRLYKSLDEALRHTEGYVASCIFTNPDDPDEVGRLSLYRTLTDIERSSRDTHIVALRSEIHNLLQPGHTEQVVEVASAINLP